MAKRNRGICTYCGKHRKLTRDHLFPSALFIERDKAMITVPACHECQQTKGLRDSDLEVLATMDIYCSVHTDNYSHAEKLVHRGEPMRRWLDKAVNEARHVPLVTDAGIQLDVALEWEYNYVRILKTMEMIARGLYFHENGRGGILPQEQPAYSLLIPWDQRFKVGVHVKQFSTGPLRTKGKNVIWWQELAVQDHSGYDRVWLVCIFDGVLFLCATGQAVELIMPKAKGDQPESTALGARSSDHVREIRLPKDPHGNYVLPPKLVEPDE